jgi:hypothetical protein
MIQIQGPLQRQESGRYAINYEFGCGDIVEVLIDGKWEKTTIEHQPGGYYLANGFAIDGAMVRTPSLSNGW